MKTDEEGAIILVDKVAVQYLDRAGVKALGGRAKDILPRETSDSIEKTLSSKRPLDLAGVAHNGVSLTLKCVPFEGEEGIKGVILVAF